MAARRVGNTPSVINGLHISGFAVGARIDGPRPLHLEGDVEIDNCGTAVSVSPDSEVNISNGNIHHNKVALDRRASSESFDLKSNRSGSELKSRPQIPIYLNGQLLQLEPHGVYPTLLALLVHLSLAG